MPEAWRELVNELAEQAGVEWMPHQWEAFGTMAQETASKGVTARMLLYYRTGGGKSLTALVALRVAGHSRALVVAPPSTHEQWEREAEKTGVDIQVVSHAKFRMANFKINRDVPIIADEFHMFGGNTAAGYKKLNRAAAGVTAPIVLCSATPNYNDAERCYCVQHILAPETCKGGFLNFLAVHCKTRLNPYSVTPYVDGFLNYASAEEYLSALPQTVFLPEVHHVPIADVSYRTGVPEEFDKYNFNRRTRSVMTSIIGRRWARTELQLIDDFGWLRIHVYDHLAEIAGAESKPIVIFSASKKVVHALGLRLSEFGVNYRTVSGDQPTDVKAENIRMFRDGGLDVLIGTAALATGTDGLDKVCDTLIILNDTDDDALRRQLIGRILPRGTDTDASMKKVYRFVPVE